MQYNLFKWKISNSDICEFCESGEKDTIVHALSKCALTRLFLTDVFELIDPYKRSVQCIDIEKFIFGVHDSALNLMFLRIKKAIIRSRTYKQYNSPSVLYRNVLRRISFDKAAIKFQQKWQEYCHLIYQSELYINAVLLWKTKWVLCLMSVCRCFVTYSCENVLCILSYVKMNKNKNKKHCWVLRMGHII